MTLLTVEDLRVRFPTDRGVVDALEGISFSVGAGEVVCLVGETGSGKTAACEAVTRLADGARIEGSVRLDGRELTDCDEATLRAVRGGRVAHVLQQPSRSLDPVFTVGEQIAEAVRLHGDASRSEARERAVSLLEDVDVAAPESRVDAYPHELSGGMRQRVAVAIALAGEPDLLVADEPTTALDVTLQASLLETLRGLIAERDLGLLFVTHDLGVVAELADRVLVLYDGAIVERGDVQAVFDRPAHPYTRLLFRSLRGAVAGDDSGADPAPDGCPFRTECPHAVPDCAGDAPSFYPADADAPDGREREREREHEHEVACVFYGPAYDADRILGGDGE